MRHANHCGADHIPEVVVAHHRGMFVQIHRIHWRNAAVNDTFCPVGTRALIEHRDTHEESLLTLNVDEREDCDGNPGKSKT